MAYVTFYAALRALINLLIDNTNTLLLIVFTLEWPASMCGLAQEDVGSKSYYSHSLYCNYMSFVNLNPLTMV